MSRVWFTADTHFGHANIIKFCGRPHRSVEAMDADMVKKWNAVVSPDDVVYHLGDFSFRDQRRYLEKLSDTKVLVLGNHDRQDQIYKAGWHRIVHYLEVRPEGTDVVLFHYAQRVWNRSHHGALHLYGHSHGKLSGDSQCCDVGVDCWDFAPVSLTQIKFFLASQKPRPREFAT